MQKVFALLIAMFASVGAFAQWTDANGNPIGAFSKDLPQTQFKTKDWILHEGTPVRMRITRTVSSATIHEGDNVDFETLDDIIVNGVTVIPRNSMAMATVTAAHSKKRMGRGGKLDMNIDYVRMPTGEKLALRGVENLKGEGRTGVMTGAIVGTAVIFWPAAPFMLFLHGNDIVIPKGQEVHVYTNSDYKIEPPRAEQSIGPEKGGR
jgi:hypothetical protein